MMAAALWCGSPLAQTQQQVDACDSKGNPQQLHLLQACFGEFHGAIHRLEVLNAEQAKQRDDVSLPQLVSGDVVLVPTEAAIDTFLYWDGKRYQLYLPDEVP